MREYLYVDADRLRQYADQIASPVIFDKVQELNVELGLMGPKAGGAQRRAARQRTNHELIELVTESLKKKRLLGENHASNEFHMKPFYHHTFTAYCGLIESKEFSLKLWFHEERSTLLSRKTAHSTILIEGPPAGGLRESHFSGYSSLLMLADQLSCFHNDLVQDLRNKLRSTHESEKRLGRDPLRLLDQLGIKFGAGRKVTSLYRVRATCMGDRRDGFPAVAIGYPLAIWE